MTGRLALRSSTLGRCQHRLIHGDYLTYHDRFGEAALHVRARRLRQRGATVAGERGPQRRGEAAGGLQVAAARPARRRSGTPACRGKPVAARWPWPRSARCRTSPTTTPARRGPPPGRALASPPGQPTRNRTRSPSNSRPMAISVSVSALRPPAITSSSSRPALAATAANSVSR